MADTRGRFDGVGEERWSSTGERFCGWQARFRRWRRCPRSSPEESGGGDWERLRARLKGPLFRPGDPGYDEARLGFFTLYDYRLPVGVAGCTTDDDVRLCVDFAARHRLPIAARSGGHSYAGYSTVDKGLIVDLAALDRIEIRPDGRVSVLLPWFEIALGVLVLVGVGTRLVAVISAGLLLLFIAGVAQAWARGLSIDCGCFGGGGEVAPEKTSYGTELLRDTGFMALAVWLIVRPATLLSSTNGWAATKSSALAEEVPDMTRPQAAATARPSTSWSACWASSCSARSPTPSSRRTVAHRAPRAPPYPTQVQGAVVTAGKAAPATVDVYEDFLCPICARFESNYKRRPGEGHRGRQDPGQVPPGGDPEPGSTPTGYSTRAANAALCAPSRQVPRLPRQALRRPARRELGRAHQRRADRQGPGGRRRAAASPSASTRASTARRSTRPPRRR